MPITKDEARALAGALNGAIGSALDRFTRNGDPTTKADKKSFQKDNSPDGVPMTRVTSANGNDHPGRPLGDSAPDFEKLYQKIKSRFIEDAKIDPILLKLIASQPEIVVEIEPREVTLEASSLRGRLARLIAANWLEEERAQFAIRKELARTGTDPGGGGNLSTALVEFVRDGFLTREGDGYKRAPGVKVTERELTVK